MPDITYDVGRVSFIMKGAWNLATNYEKLDAVSYNGSLYIAKQNVPGGTAITNTTYWQLAAEKGDKGDTGGVDSVNGQQGDIWFPDSRQLISDGYTTDTEPFLMKGNDSDSDRFELAKKLGNTVCVNDLVRNGNFADTSVWSNLSSWKSATVSDHTLHLVSNANQAAYINIQQASPVSPIVGHKYLFLIDVKASKSSNLGASFGTTAGGCVFNVNGYSANTWIHIALIGTVSSYTDDTLYIRPKASDDAEEVDIYIKNVALIDLTLWFGSNDRIPADLLAHPENWGRYYAGLLAYNAGTLESADGSVLKSIGRNVWDEEWELGIYNVSTGAKQSSSVHIRSKNLIPVIPNTAYYFRASAKRELLQYDADGNFIYYDLVDTSNQSFTTQPNCHFIAFSMYSGYGTTYLNNITISLYYPGESGYDQYYPFSVLASVDTGGEVLRSAGAVADEKTPDGTITRRVGTVDLGTLAWSKVTTGGQTFFYAELSNGSTADDFAGICPKYPIITAGTWTNNDKVARLYGSTQYSFSRVGIKDSAYSSGTDAAFKTAMSGVYLYYELAAPTTEQGTAFAKIVATVKGGELSWTNTKGIPVGQESHWFENLRKRVEDRLPDPPSADGTYRLTCTISGGVKTYSWEA